MGNEQRIVADQGPVRHLLTVEDFLVLDEAGAFEDIGRHVELIEGEIFVMAPLYFPHGRIHADLTTDLGLAVRALNSTLQVLTPVSAKVDSHSLPEADIIVADIAGFDGNLVTASMIRLLVEVSASSLAHDMGRKLRLYARAGVPEYWVADVAGRRIIRCHAPAGDAYRERAEFAFGAGIPAATIAGLGVDTARLASA